MDHLSLEELIRSHIHLPPHASSQGWYPILCKICNDHGKKGDRAAFKLEAGAVGYHCFNCSAAASFDPATNNFLPKKMEDILLAFGIPQDEINQVKFGLLATDTETPKPSKKVVSREPKAIPLPSHFKLLDHESIWAEVAKEYLLERCIDPESYPFMISTGIPEDLDKHPKQTHAAKIKEAQKWLGRVIIPVFKDDNLIFYTGRDMSGTMQEKYKNPSQPKHNIIFGFDQIFRNTEESLYIMEGIFDAMVINGIAVLGNELSDNQIYWINRSTRPKIYIPDRYGDGGNNALKAVDQGWSVGFPDIGECKDINEAVEKYGKLYVLASIAKNTTSGLQAQVRIRLDCT